MTSIIPRNLISMSLTILVNIVIIAITLLLEANFASANQISEFETYMNDWNQKRELASQLLIEAEKSFKEGDELSGCVAQRKAGSYGIEASNSLIKAMEANGSSEGIDNIKSGLAKWKELADFC